MDWGFACGFLTCCLTGEHKVEGPTVVWSSKWVLATEVERVMAMIRVLLLDFSSLVIDDGCTLPHVSEALEAMSQFETGLGEPLAMSLVSDRQASSHGSAQQTSETLLQRFVADLDDLGLTRFFEPVDQHVTLSIQAGARKLDRRVFATAVKRLGSDASPEQCLFITRARELDSSEPSQGMEMLGWGPPGSPGADFNDWSECPLLIAHLVGSKSNHNLQLALNARLAVTEGLRLTTLSGRSTDGRLEAQAQVLHRLHGPHLGAAEGVHMELPTRAKIRLDPRGRIEGVDREEPEAEDVAEATHFAKTLIDNQQVATTPGPLPPGTTHQVETDAEGRRVLKRKRFSAI
jgi:hypothetical protein